MEVNPYLATTGGLFGLSWETDLNKSYVMSQQIYIDCIYGAWLLFLFLQEQIKDIIIIVFSKLLFRNQ